MTARPLIVLDWQVGLASGWGTYGAMLCRYAKDRCDVALIQNEGQAPVAYSGLSPDDARHIATLDILPRASVPRHAILLTALGNHGNGQYGGWPAVARRKAAYGIIFSEDTQFHADEVARLNTYDGIIAGSSWNADILRTRGVENVHVVRQGVDLDRFYPRISTERDGAKAGHGLTGKFAVFSGGKLEYRKGQDIVVAAFRELLKSVPDAVLVHAWHNHWPNTMQSISVAGLTSGAPATSADIGAWLDANGIPEANRLDVGLCRNDQMPTVLAACDVAVFPNRAEGGTNLVAMEALACGVPTYASRNTGHLDLIQAEMIASASIAGPVAGYAETEGWGEVVPDDLTSVLRAAVAAPRGHGPLMDDWSWELSIGRLLDLVTADAGVPA